VYLRAGAIVLAIAATVVAWNVLHNQWKQQYVVLLDVPVRMSGVTTQRLYTKVPMSYDIAIKFRVNGDDPRIMCRIGYLPARYPDIDHHQCARYPAAFFSSWLLRDARRIVERGHTGGKAEKFSFAGGEVEASLGYFTGHPGRPQDLSLTFQRDLRSLSFAGPRLVVQASWLSADRELGVAWIEGAVVLAGFGIILVLIEGIRSAVRRARNAH
jgi:hypothetical protein